MTDSATTTSPLFEPARLGDLTLRNRLVMAPMTRTFSPGGVPGPDVAAYYRRRAQGGVGLIMTEGTWIDHPSASNEPNAPRFYGEDALAGWRRVVEEVHEAGARIMPQLWHVGLTHRPKAANIYDDIEEDFSQRLSPSGYVMPGEKIAEGMTEAQVQALIAAYADGARTARELGFDGVELHGAHGYLIDQFFWHETNHRSDQWGGRTLAQRAAFGAAVVRACREAVGPDFPIVFRFSQWKLQNYEARLAETPAELESLLAPLAEAGVTAFHASQRRFWQPEFSGSPLNLAGWAQKLTGRPAITVGSVGLDQDMAGSMVSAEPTRFAGLDRLMEMLERGDFTLVAVGRALIADPDWPEKVQRGDFDAIAAFSPAVLASLE
jgi:2,4-dienoyl-CoA reductase-like NADH-dependent reductase (Old Yellow Enzyme family)